MTKEATLTTTIDRFREALLRFAAVRDWRSYESVLEEYLGIGSLDNTLHNAVETAVSFSKTKVDMDSVSDGFHTFDELYRYRMLYNAAFFSLAAHDIADWGVHKSRFHSDGEPCFGGGWFIVVAYLPTGQISNHYPEADWNKFNIPERIRADEWDGHTPEQAAQRLEDYLLGKWENA